MTTEVEPYRMIEPQTFSDHELTVIHWRQPSVGEVLWFAVRWVFWMIVTYIVICELCLLGG